MVSISLYEKAKTTLIHPMETIYSVVKGREKKSVWL